MRGDEFRGWLGAVTGTLSVLISSLALLVSRDNAVATNGAQINMKVDLKQNDKFPDMLALTIYIRLYNDGGSAARNVRGYADTVETNDLEYAVSEFKKRYCWGTFSDPLGAKIPKNQFGYGHAYLVSVEPNGGTIHLENPSATTDRSEWKYYVMACAVYDVGSFLLMPSVRSIEFEDYEVYAQTGNGTFVSLNGVNAFDRFKSFSFNLLER